METHIDLVSLIQTENRSIGNESITIILLRVMYNSLTITVQVNCHILSVLVVHSSEAEVVGSSDGGCEHTCSSRGGQKSALFVSLEILRCLLFCAPVFEL